MIRTGVRTNYSERSGGEEAFLLIGPLNQQLLQSSRDPFLHFEVVPVERIQKPIQTRDYLEVPGYKANIRESDNRVLGIVTDRYKIVQNQEAFAFTDELLGEGVRFETAGSLQKGKKVWMLAKLPQSYNVTGDNVNPYLVISNSHDCSGAIKVAMTPIRIVVKIHLT